MRSKETRRKTSLGTDRSQRKQQRLNRPDLDEQRIFEVPRRFDFEVLFKGFEKHLICQCYDRYWQWLKRRNRGDWSRERSVRRYPFQTIMRRKEKG